MNGFDFDAWNWPRPGITGWSDRTEGPLWRSRGPWWRLIDREQGFVGVYSRHNKLAPYCVFVTGERGRTAAANVLPCRYTPGFPCCRWGYTKPRPNWLDWEDRRA